MSCGQEGERSDSPQQGCAHSSLQLASSTLRDFAAKDLERAFIFQLKCYFGFSHAACFEAARCWLLTREQFGCCCLGGATARVPAPPSAGPGSCMDVLMASFSFQMKAVNQRAPCDEKYCCPEGSSDSGLVRSSPLMLRL